jgi:hypothetical protein
MNNCDPKLVLRDTPFVLWFIGFIFAGVGLLMAFESEPPLVMTLLFIGVGVTLVVTASIVTITADRTTRILQMKSRSVIRRKLIEVPFDDIIGVNVERSASSGRGARYTYRLVLLRKDGQVIPLQQFSSSGFKSKEKMAVRLREFLGIQATNRVPSGMIPMELAQSEAVHETGGIHWQIQPLMTHSSSAPTGARWLSPDFKTSSFFLFVAQKGEGQSSNGFLASLGKMFLRQAFSAHGFRPEDAPGLDEAAVLRPLDMAVENHFMAYTNVPDSARLLLNAVVVMQMAKWSERYPLRQAQAGGRHSQLMMLFGPNGVSVATNHLQDPGQTYELISLGVELVKSQKTAVQNPNIGD